MDTKKIKEMDREHVLHSWTAQKDVSPIIMDHADGIYQWDTDGKKYIDFCSGLLNINIGHSNKHVLDAMKTQMDKLCSVGTMFGSEPKAKLGKMIAEVTPGDLDYNFFTNGGAEAIETAIKSVRLATGRHKIYSRWRSYHGATAGAITLTGDPIRWPEEPGIPGVVKFLGPYPYRDPFVGELTYGGHALGCAAGIANIEVYKNDNLIENSAVIGEHMKKRLLELKEKHACVGDVRSIGLWAALELTSDKQTRAPLAGFNNSIQNVAPEFLKRLAELGLTLFARWDFVFIAPPLIITKEQVDEAVDIIDEALKVVDTKIK